MSRLDEQTNVAHGGTALHQVVTHRSQRTNRTTPCADRATKYRSVASSEDVWVAAAVHQGVALG